MRCLVFYNPGVLHNGPRFFVIEIFMLQSVSCAPLTGWGAHSYIHWKDAIWRGNRAST